MSFVTLASLLLMVVPGVVCMECVVKPPATVVDTTTAWATSLFGIPLTPLVVDELNGKSDVNVFHVTHPGGHVMPPHRHNGSVEYVYVTGGSGEVTVLLPGKAERETFALKAGDFHLLPAWGIHDIRASAKEPLAMLVLMSPAPAVIETFETWPESTDVPVRAVSTVMGFVDGCPPGQELPKEEL